MEDLKNCLPSSQLFGPQLDVELQSCLIALPRENLAPSPTKLGYGPEEKKNSWLSGFYSVQMMRRTAGNGCYSKSDDVD